MRRQKARETAFLLLYRMDMGGLTMREAEECVEHQPDPDIWHRAREWVQGVTQNRTRIDAIIARLSPDRDLERISCTDRNVLRLAAFELLYAKETPAAVVADQAIKLARKYGSPDSNRFVNGILGSIVRENEQIPRDPNLG
jgi:N utilization substance protein B